MQSVFIADPASLRAEVAAPVSRSSSDLPVRLVRAREIRYTETSLVREFVDPSVEGTAIHKRARSCSWFGGGYNPNRREDESHINLIR